MTTITLPYRTQLVQGQPERIAYVLSDMDAILAVVNGNLDGNNINPAAAIAVQKLGITGTPDGTKFLRDDSSWQLPAIGGFRAITDSVLGATTVSFDFTSIPQTYKHLYLEAYIRSAAGADPLDVYLQFNSDTTANYDNETVNFSGTAATKGAQEQLGTTRVVFQNATVGTSVANVFTPLYIWIPHYANAINQKMLVARYAWKRGVTTGLMYVGRVTGCWRSSAAINSIKLYEQSGGGFVSGSRATLYGLM